MESTQNRWTSFWNNAFLIGVGAFICVFTGYFRYNEVQANALEHRALVAEVESLRALANARNSNILELGCGEHIKSIGVTDAGDPYVVYSHSPNTIRRRADPQDTIYEIYSPNPDLTLTIRRCFPEE